METLKIQYEIDFEEMLIKFFVVLNKTTKGFGIKLKYKGLYESNTLEKSIASFVENVHSTFEKHLVKVRGDTYHIESLTKEELSVISDTVLNNYL